MATISLCMIARNEEQLIANAISSVKHFVDEIIVVDTGSSDKTPEMAKEQGASVFHFKWVDDFSAARNFALSKVSSDWVLVLDADEEMLEPDARKLPQMADKECDAFIMTQRNFSNVQGFGFVPEARKGFAGFYPTLVVRMFRSGKGIEFDSFVHESVDLSLARIKANVALAADVSICHFQELKGIDHFKAKQLKYAELMERNIGKFKDKAKAYADIGIVHYRFMQDYSGAIKYFLKSLEFKPKNAAVLNDLAAAYVQIGDLKAAQVAFAKSMEIQPNAFTLYNIALVHQKIGDSESAAFAFEEAARMGHPRAAELLGRASALRASDAGKK